METIGFLELNSIAKGMEVADCVLKTAEVKLVFSRAGCPGKYYLLFTGEVAAVQESIDAGCRLGGQFVVDHCVIPRVHPQVISAIHSATMLDNMRAIGVMEFFSVAKAADVQLLDVRLGTGIGGKSFVVLTGEVAAVSEAVSCGISTPNAEGMVVSSVVIPGPHPELLDALM